MEQFSKVTFEDETGKKKIVLNVHQFGNELKIQAFALPPVTEVPVAEMPLYQRLAGTLTNQLIQTADSVKPTDPNQLDAFQELKRRVNHG